MFLLLLPVLSNGRFLYSKIAIDIVIAGPPCNDFSAVNANRRGVDGARGSYILRLGNLIRKIQDHPVQQGTPLYIVVENVNISEKDGLSKVENHLRCTGHQIDAKDFSPCKRDRMYFTNVSSTGELRKLFCSMNDYEYKFLNRFRWLEITSTPQIR